MSKKSLTYWDEIKNHERFYYGGDMGWEIKLCWDMIWDNRKSQYKKTLRLQWPNWVGTDIPRSERSKCVKEVKFKIFKEKTLAKISSNMEEYRELNKRVRDVNEEEFREIVKHNKFGLKKHIQENYWTEEESFASFWRG